MMGSISDTHCHLNSPIFAGRVGDVLARAAEAGVDTVIVPGWDRESSLQALALAAAYPIVRPAVGLHPWFVTPAADLSWLPDLLDDPRVVAVGEIGLDWACESHPRDQEAAFRAQLQLARERDLPVLLHCGRGWDVLLACLRETPVRGVAHAFSGSLETLRACVQLGLHVSFAGMVTRENSRRAHAAARAVPADRLLLETDAPYMTLDGVPAEESEPAHVVQILAYVAALRGDDPARLAAQVATNARAVFGE